VPADVGAAMREHLNRPLVVAWWPLRSRLSGTKSWVRSGSLDPYESTTTLSLIDVKQNLREAHQDEVAPAMDVINAA
jgi:hypothetical protein